MKINMVQAINAALKEEMLRDETVVVLGEDVGVDGGVFRVTDGLKQQFNERVIDTPLAELAIAGISVGLAINGLKPVAEIQFSGFSYSCLDPLINHGARIRNRSRGKFSCPMVLRCPYSGGIHAPEHHSESMENLFVHTPGLKVVIPSTPYDAKGLLISAIRDPDPVIYYEPKKVYRAIKEEIPEESFIVKIGKAKIAKEGKDITIISYGAMMWPSLKAAELLEKENINCEVIDIRTLKPLDTETIIDSVKKTGRVVVVNEAPKTSGFAAEIISVINEKAFLNLEAPIKRVTGFDIPFPLFSMEDKYLPNEIRIIKEIKEVMNF
jgi:pyruvate dehydrogenase E1 component beta subunit